MRLSPFPLMAAPSLDERCCRLVDAPARLTIHPPPCTTLASAEAEAQEPILASLTTEGVEAERLQ
jgi:hypothetical protein